MHPGSPCLSSLDLGGPSRLRIAAAARVIFAGGVVAYPTEAVFGLGCLPENGSAAARILRLKRRSQRKGMLLIAADVEAIERYVVLDERCRLAAILASWPGPNTWVLPARPGVPDWITGGRGSVGVRVTAHPIAHALCRQIGRALVSTSANLSGHPPARDTLAARRRLGRLVDYVLAGEVGGAAKPTTIRDGLTGRVLRPA